MHRVTELFIDIVRIQGDLGDGGLHKRWGGIVKFDSLEPGRVICVYTKGVILFIMGL